MKSVSNRQPNEQPESQMLNTPTHPFVDIHCHCLPGIDDGPADVGESIALCKALSDDGISTVIATPHQLGRWDDSNWAAPIREGVANLKAALEEAGIPLNLFPGADVRIDERLCALIDEDKVLTLADKGKHILLELPHEVFIDIEFLLAELNSKGIRGIVTHPERNAFLKRQPDAVLKWVNEGCVLQITAASLIGRFGPEAQRAAWHFLDMPFALTIATDAHDCSSRCPCMLQAYGILKEHRGRRIARLLCVDNPMRIVQGQEALAIAEFARGEQ